MGLAAATRPVRPGPPAPSESVDSFCRTGGRPAQRLYVPGDNGYLGRLSPRGQALTLTAGPAGSLPATLTTGNLGVAVRHGGRRYVNPTLVLQRGERMRVDAGECA